MLCLNALSFQLDDPPEKKFTNTETDISLSYTIVIALETLTQWNSIIFQVACKYIENPVLFHREDVGHVKFDVRYLVLISSAKPLVLHADKVFWLRFANQ